MFEDSPEKSPATPMMITTNHFCFLVKIWNGCSEAGRFSGAGCCTGSNKPSCGPDPAMDRCASASTSSGERKGLTKGCEEIALKLLGAWENVRLCSSALESLVLIEALSSNQPKSGSNRVSRFDSNTTEETVDPGARYTPRPTSRQPSRVVNRRRSAGLSSALFMADVEYVVLVAAGRWTKFCRRRAHVGLRSLRTTMATCNPGPSRDSPRRSSDVL